MKLGVLGDVHANQEALDKVLSHFERNGVDKLVHVGDIVGYCADFESVIRTIAENRIPGVIGNHEQMLLGTLVDERVTREAADAIAWMKSRISENQLAFLRDLPTDICNEDYVVFHACPGDSTYRFASVDRARRVFSAADERWPDWQIAFHGHMHRQQVFSNSSGESELVHRGQGRIELKSGMRYLACPGSVGISRDTLPETAYLIYDTVGEMDFGRLEYDWQKRGNLDRAAGLNSRLYRPVPSFWRRSINFVSSLLRKWTSLKDRP